MYGPASRLSRYYRSIQHGKGDESGQRRYTDDDDYTPKQKAQIAKRDAKHGMTAPVERFAVDSSVITSLALAACLPF